MHRYKWLTPIALTLFLVTAGCGNTTNNAGSAGFSYNAIGNGGNSGGSMNNHAQRQNRSTTTSANAVTFLPMTLQVMQIDPRRKTVMLAVRDTKGSKNQGGTAAHAANLPGSSGSSGTTQNITIPVGWTLHVSGPPVTRAGSGKLLAGGVISVLRYPLTNSPGMGNRVNPQIKEGRTAITNTPQADTWGLRGTNVTTVVGGPVAARDTTFKATIPGQYAIIWAVAGGPPHVLSRMTVSNTVAKPLLATGPTTQK